jgi:HD-GYP domain-containing protein (c-di-GMP phosphodiesterase class II)
VHDIGKIGVADSILRKPGALEMDEMTEMRKHPEVGARILAGADLEDISSWVLAHHERPDGGGYPGSLHGDAVPEGASLLALADAWDVMVSDRSYSAPMTVEAALAEARARAGTQFAVTAVEALESLARRGDLMPAAARLHLPTL